MTLDCLLALVSDGRYFALAMVFPTACGKADLATQTYPCLAVIQKHSVRRFQFDPNLKPCLAPESDNGFACLLAVKGIEFKRITGLGERIGGDLPNLSSDVDVLELWKDSPLDLG